MGIGLCEYRAVVGAFAWIAINAGLGWRSRTKKQKSRKLREVGKEERCKRERSPNSKMLKKRCVSLDRWRTRGRIRNVGQRSQTLNERKERGRRHVSFRRRSQSHAQRKRKNQEMTTGTLKNSCIDCKTKLFKERVERGRRPHHFREKCSHDYERAGNKSKDIEQIQLQFLASAAASVCLLLEQTIFTIVQILLVRAGVETNPGPTSPSSPPCCNASQHFNRVKNTMEKAQRLFQTKVTQDTLTRKAVVIEQTGIFLPNYQRKILYRSIVEL